MVISFPKLKQWQEDVYNDITEARGSAQIFVVKSKRQVGKTSMAEIIMLKYAFEMKSTICLVEPVLSQSRRVFKQICGYLENTGLIKSANAQTLELVLTNGSEILFKSAEQRDTLRGMTLDLLVIDEGAFIPSDVYEVLFPTADVKKAPILVISTTLFTDGKFYELFNDKANKTYDWSRYDTSDFLSQERLEYYRKTLSANKFKSEYLGEFITDGSFVFGDIRPCIKKTSNQPIYGGIDWGTGSEGDYSVITLMDEFGNQTMLEYKNNLAPTEQVDWMADVINRHTTLKYVQVEMNSIGKVYFDMLIRKVRNRGVLRQFNTTNDSKRRIIEQLVKGFQTDTIGILDDNEQISQLQHYAMEKTKNGYTYNAISGYHDDCCMALAMAYDLIGDGNGYTLSFMNNRFKKYGHGKG